ncbi:MAG TPA: hypothetical protein VJP40_08385 [bacterium]|nr:hypothetical protein [bacterium]
MSPPVIKNLSPLPPRPSVPEQASSPLPLTNEEWAGNEAGNSHRGAAYLKRLEKRRLRQLRRGDYAIEPRILKAAARNAILTFRETGSHQAMYEALHRDLLKAYPSLIAKDLAEPTFNYAGTVTGKIQVLHCSRKEYLIFYWSAIGSEGPSGRYRRMDVWDFLLDGKQRSESETGYEANAELGPGSIHYLPRGSATHYATPGGAWYLEYGRSEDVWASAMKFGIFAPARGFSQDRVAARKQIRQCLRIMLKGKG